MGNLLITKVLNTNYALFLKKCRFTPKLHKIGKVCRGNFNISHLQKNQFRHFYLFQV